MRRTAITLALLLVAGASVAPSAGAQQVSDLEVLSQGNGGGDSSYYFPAYFDSTDDLSRVYFGTYGKLTPEDGDEFGYDVFEGTGTETRLISTGPDDAEQNFDIEWGDASADGSHVYFLTADRLVAEDDDGDGWDLYARVGDDTLLVSLGPVSEHPSAQVLFRHATADGSRVWFETTEALVDEDDDEAYDVYEWSGVQGEVELVSTGPTDAPQGPETEGMTYLGATADGTQVFFLSLIALTDEDGDDAPDIYRRAGGVTTLVTPDPAMDDDGVAEMGVDSVSADGTRVYIGTTEGLVAEDGDGAWDLYEVSGDDAALLTPGTEYGGEGFEYVGRTGGGARIFFKTPEALVAADTDENVDIYERSNGQYTLLSTGPEADGGDFDAEPDALTPDGSRLIFHTRERLTDEDADNDEDLYVLANGELRLISDLGDDFPEFGAMSADGTRVIYSGDNDDVFVNDGGASVRLLFITGDVRRLSADGTRLLLASSDGLLEEDIDAEYDIYRMTLALPPRNTAPPVISGTPAVGGALSCSTGAWSGDEADFAFAWNRNGTPITGATAASYTVAPPDGGKQLTCTVTATNDIGSASATSAAVAVPAVGGPPPPPPPPPPPAGPAPGACANPQTGTAGADALTGTDAGDRLRGLAGDDVLGGLGGADCLVGGAGEDRLSGDAGADRLSGSKGDDAAGGGGGADRLTGGAGDDALSGGRGADRLKGDAGVDRFTGGSGDDVILAADGEAETVRCGAGRRDRVVADGEDRLRGCERTRRVR